MFSIDTGPKYGLCSYADEDIGGRIRVMGGDVGWPVVAEYSTGRDLRLHLYLPTRQWSNCCLYERMDALKLCSRFMISCTSRRVLPSWMYNRTISGRNSFQGFVILENKIREANNRGRVGEPRK
jgi:hypothetical protein